MCGLYITEKCYSTIVKLMVGFLLLMPHHLSLSCPSVCQHCTRTLMECCNLGLTSIPSNLAKSASSIYLSGNNISSIISIDFEGFNRMSALFLDNNDLISVHPQAFVSLVDLYYLRLNNNQIKHLNQGIFEGLSKLRYLHLQCNQIISIPVGLFSDLTALQYLQLEGNSLRSLSHGMFTGLISLRTLHLANNRISWISTSSFRHLSRLEFLDLQSNRLAWIPSNAFVQLKVLKRLILSNNPIELLHPLSFSGLENLKYLNLNNAKIKAIPKDGFTALNSLRHLVLSNNSITHINSNVFKVLKLRYLQLDDNNISFIESDAFEGMSRTLKTLHLANNNLTNLFPEVLMSLSSLVHLMVDGNPWECNCNMLNMRNWLLSSSFRVNIRCQSPSQLRGKSLYYTRISKISGCNVTLAPLGLNVEIRSPATRVALTSVKTDSPNLHFNLEHSSVTEESFGDAALAAKDKEQFLSTLPVQLPIEYTPISFTTLTDSDMAAISIKPLAICKQNLTKLNQTFDILLVFFILACTAVLLLTYKVHLLRQKLKELEAEGNNVLEYYSVYPFARYHVTDPVQAILPERVSRPQVHQATTLKITCPANQAQVILFEHSVL
ncbi:leucine-rich repeat-containing protein 70-like [Leucoraja erinacea]|uniref:leucine-rich repeat-containing protein 70-like n=1 Tax=Leucoraja erinaceus TaxID=7782 RepID=UPI0024575037|nr:leucine-rich repeat-containing protein 70-like [Leucoraja erinacea]